jgi:hypothetical protein
MCLSECEWQRRDTQSFALARVVLALPPSDDQPHHLSRTLSQPSYWNLHFLGSAHIGKQRYQHPLQHHRCKFRAHCRHNPIDSMSGTSLLDFLLKLGQSQPPTVYIAVLPRLLRWDDNDGCPFNYFNTFAVGDIPEGRRNFGN